MGIGSLIGVGANNAGSTAASIMNALHGSRQGSYSRTDTAAQAMFNYNTMQEAMAYNSAEAQKQRDWQERMANTSYQRAVEDMRKAGINPILAFQQGGAETPGGGTASAAPARIGQDRMSSSFGISGLAEGLGQIWGALEGFGLDETANNVKESILGAINYITDNNSPSRKGGFGGSSNGGSFRG